MIFYLSAAQIQPWRGWSFFRFLIIRIVGEIWIFCPLLEDYGLTNVFLVAVTETGRTFHTSCFLFKETSLSQFVVSFRRPVKISRQGQDHFPREWQTVRHDLVVWWSQCWWRCDSCDCDSVTNQTFCFVVCCYIDIVTKGKSRLIRWTFVELWWILIVRAFLNKNKIRGSFYTWILTFENPKRLCLQ